MHFYMERVMRLRQHRPLTFRRLPAGPLQLIPIHNRADQFHQMRIKIDEFAYYAAITAPSAPGWASLAPFWAAAETLRGLLTPLHALSAVPTFEAVLGLTGARIAEALLLLDARAADIVESHFLTRESQKTGEAVRTLCRSASCAYQQRDPCCQQLRRTAQRRGGRPPADRCAEKCVDISSEWARGVMLCVGCRYAKHREWLAALRSPQISVLPRAPLTSSEQCRPSRPPSPPRPFASARTLLAARAAARTPARRARLPAFRARPSSPRLVRAPGAISALLGCPIGLLWRPVPLCVISPCSRLGRPDTLPSPCRSSLPVPIQSSETCCSGLCGQASATVAGS